MSGELLQQELAAYKAHKTDLLATAEGKYALVRGDEISGTFESLDDALAEGYRKFGNVPFLVKQITAVDAPVNFVSSLLEI